MADWCFNPTWQPLIMSHSGSEDITGHKSRSGRRVKPRVGKAIVPRILEIQIQFCTLSQLIGLGLTLSS